MADYSSQMPGALSWRKMRTADLAEVLQIERNTQSIPWSRLAFEESLTRSEIAEASTYYCRVLDTAENPTQRGSKETEPSVLAFFIVSSVLDELHIMNLAVTPWAQGKGLGHALMDEMLRLANSLELNRVFLEVRASNEKAISLYRKWGFEQVAVRPKYYRTSRPDEKEDAWVFCAQLTNTVNT
jgi:ribosomal-protein-alanine N-acetyltransferase